MEEFIRMQKKLDWIIRQIECLKSTCGTDIPSQDIIHNETSFKQGGNPTLNEFYHLSLSERDGLINLLENPVPEFSFGSGLRVDSGVVHLGVDVSPGSTGLQGLMTVDTSLIRTSIGGDTYSSISFGDESNFTSVILTHGVNKVLNIDGIDYDFGSEIVQQVDKDTGSPILDHYIYSQAGDKGIYISEDSMIIEDTITFTGASYAENYSANNTTNPRWITDKQYVDDLILGSVKRFGVEDNLASQDRIIDMDSYKMEFNHVGEFNIDGGDPDEIYVPTTIPGIMTYDDVNSILELYLTDFSQIHNYEPGDIFPVRFTDGANALIQNFEAYFDGIEWRYYNYNYGISGETYTYQGYFILPTYPIIRMNIQPAEFSGQDIIFIEGANELKRGPFIGTDTAQDVYSRGSDVNIDTPTTMITSDPLGHRIQVGPEFPTVDGQSSNQLWLQNNIHQSVIRYKISDIESIESTFQQTVNVLQDPTAISFRFGGGYLGYQGDVSDDILALTSLQRSVIIPSTGTVEKLIPVIVPNLYGIPNGIANLDGGGKIPVSYLPNSVMTLEGAWNASTNSPTLVDGVGNAGMVYEVTVAGTQNLGSGNITFAVGDWVVYGNDGKWYKSLNSNEVTSVNGYTGTVVLTKSDIGLGNVDNTSDLNKPISTATQTALDNKVTKGGDSGAVLVVGTTDNNNFILRRNSINQITFSTNDIQVARVMTLSEHLQIDPTKVIRASNTNGVSIGLGTTTTASTFSHVGTPPVGFQYTAGSATQDISRWTGSSNSAGVRIDCRVYGMPATNSSDFTTLSQLNAKVTDAIVDGVTTVAPSQNAVFDALALKADISSLTGYIRLGADNLVPSLNKVSYMTEAQYSALTPSTDTAYFIEELVPDKISNLVISAATYGLTYISKRIVITFTGTGTTLTLPPITGGEGVEILLINRGSDAAIINTNTGANDIRTFPGLELNTYSIQPNSQLKLYNNGIKLEIVWEQETLP